MLCKILDYIRDEIVDLIDVFYRLRTVLTLFENVLCSIIWVTY